MAMNLVARMKRSEIRVDPPVLRMSFAKPACFTVNVPDQNRASMDLKLRNAAVLITGASRGLGREFAIAFAGEGARVAICERDPAKLEEAAAAVRARGTECLALQAD